jgi:hypothetical protein
VVFGSVIDAIFVKDEKTSIFCETSNSFLFSTKFVNLHLPPSFVSNFYFLFPVEKQFFKV